MDKKFAGREFEGREKPAEFSEGSAEKQETDRTEGQVAGQVPERTEIKPQASLETGAESGTANPTIGTAREFSAADASALATEIMGRNIDAKRAEQALIELMRIEREKKLNPVTKNPPA